MNENKQIISMVSHVVDQLNNVTDKLFAINQKINKINRQLKTREKKARPRKDLTGQVFGKLTVIERAPDRKDKYRTRTMWLCRCECGREKAILTTNLTGGQSQSCGCSLRSLEPRVMHGHTKKRVRSPTYSTWNCMNTRCNCESHSMYYNYGAKGITVCKRWQKFTNFLEDMGERPSPDHQIHRLDKEKGYEPDNCMWVHRKDHKRLENECVHEWKDTNDGIKTCRFCKENRYDG